MRREYIVGAAVYGLFDTNSHSAKYLARSKLRQHVVGLKVLASGDIQLVPSENCNRFMIRDIFYGYLNIVVLYLTLAWRKN